MWSGLEISNEFVIDSEYSSFSLQDNDSCRSMTSRLKYEIMLHISSILHQSKNWRRNRVINFLLLYYLIRGKWLISAEDHRPRNSVVISRQQNISFNLSRKLINKRLVDSLLSVPLIVKVFLNSIDQRLLHPWLRYFTHHIRIPLLKIVKKLRSEVRYHSSYIPK